MGVDTKILVSYGILIPIQCGEYLRNLLAPEINQGSNSRGTTVPHRAESCSARNGVPLEAKHSKTAEAKIIDYVNDNIVFSSDGYASDYNEMFIHLKSCTVDLFNERTGGNGGYGTQLNSQLSQLQDANRPTEEEKKQFNRFCNFVSEKIKNKLPHEYSEKHYEPGVFVYYYNW
jgi:hypothetical protein